MTSNINPDTINIDFPVANTNNLSQGFRDNFAEIRLQLETAAKEISNLQNLQVSLLGVLDSPPVALSNNTG